MTLDEARKISIDSSGRTLDQIREAFNVIAAHRIKQQFIANKVVMRGS